MTLRHSPWRFVDLRHQKNGQIALWCGSDHVANVLARHKDCVEIAVLIVETLNASQEKGETK